MAFLLAGVLGFIPGITTHYDEMTFAGHSGALLLGIFAVSILHNLVHLLFGVLGLFAAKKSPPLSRAFLVVGGGVYVVLWVYGSAIGEHTGANFLPINTADNWLHLGLGAGMILLGVATTAVERKRSDSPVN
ncbi:protein of unknown function [Lentzea fradiae]|uniref:DUF4383 domain-containing protein n=1 Tax=Lentzea fradiae TaxID=200378 RepID=A0A1G7KJ14_9PSEU|nr:protein of unknown function [Lentzea fradiae]